MRPLPASRLLLLTALCTLVGQGCHDPDRPPEVVEISVTGENFEWHSRYGGPDGKLGTADDVPARQILHVPTDTRIVIHLTSRDYLYTFMLPQLEAKEIAVPDLIFTVEFRTGAPGTFELRGDQLCGYAHKSLLGELVVEPPRAWRQWLEKMANQDG